MNKELNTDLQQRLSDSEFTKEFGAELAKSEVAVALARARLTCNVTQVYLANKLETNQSYIAKLERGDANPTIGMIGKVLAFMGLRLKVYTEPILRDTKPRVVTSREGTNDMWNLTWPPHGIDVIATSKTETREEMVAVGGYR
jgi:transcriptional regulator with XRE-family HTH domain